MKNMVDERFELAALIFRLAGRPEFGGLILDYQKEVAETFSKFIQHEAIVYAKAIGIGYDKVFKFSVHIEKRENQFVFIDDIGSLMGNGWNLENAETFLKLFNKFYVDTDYADFYNAHRTLFEQATQHFIDEVYGKIDFKWFSKYVDTANLRCIYSLSSGNFGATVNDNIIYCQVFMRNGNAPMVHEYCHSFGNPLANKWYEENESFKKWCDESVNEEKMPYYNNGHIMAYEYVTRAFNILYEVQHGADLNEQLAEERDSQFKDSFKYIENIYNMILALE